MNESIGLILDKLENFGQNQTLKTEIVYIKEILNPNLQSLLRLGDQILEINGIAVTNLNDARSILDNPILNEFNILFSRLNIHHDHKICEQRINLRKQKVLWLKRNSIQNKNCSQNIDNNSLVINEKLQNKDTEKDSGLGKQTDQESLYTRTNETCSSNDYGDVFNSPDKNGSVKKSDSLSSIEKDILILNKVMESINFECEMLNRDFNDKKSSQSINSEVKTGQLTRQLSDLSNNFSVFNRIDKKEAIEKKESIKKWIKSIPSKNSLNINKEKNNLSDNSNKVNKLIKTTNNVPKSDEIHNKLKNRLSNSKTDGNLIKRSGSMISLSSIDHQNDNIVKINKKINRKNLDCPSEHEYAVINYDNTNSLINRLDDKMISKKSTVIPPPLPPMNSRKNSSSLDVNEENEFKIATMYTDKANLHQTIHLQQQLLLQAIEKKQKNLEFSNSSSNHLPNSCFSKTFTKRLPILNDKIENNKIDLFGYKKIEKNKFLMNNAIIKLKRKSDRTNYISSKKLTNVEENEAFKQKIINCNKNLINHNCSENQKLKKSKDNDCKLKENSCSKHLVKSKSVKKTNYHKFLNEFKSKNKLDDEKLKKMRLQNSHLVSNNTDIFTVATV